MKKLFFLFFFFFCLSVKAEENLDIINLEEDTENLTSNDSSLFLDFEEEKDIDSLPKYESPLKKVGKFVWGTPVDNALLTGMVSYHANKNSRREDRWNHNLIGIQYKGFIASTYTNSHNNQTFFVGFIDKSIFSSHLKFQASYKLGLLYGYKKQFLNIGGITPAPLPFVGLSYRRIAFEIMPIPSSDPVIAAYMRINLYPLQALSQNKKAREE